MKNVMVGRFGGFTLIELLVVVLIIGILAAVALPQYQRAVGKARAVEAKTVLESLQKAVYLSYLETGEHPSMENLSISVPESNSWKYEIDECCLAYGFGCSLDAIDVRTNRGRLRLVDKEYAKACGGASEEVAAVYSGFMCSANEGFEDYCPNMGFTKYESAIDLFKEP